MASKLFASREGVVWMPANGAFGFHLPPPMSKREMFLGVVRGPVKSTEAAIATFRKVLAPKVADARRRGQLSHELFVRIPMPGGPSGPEIIGLDLWCDGQGMGEHYKNIGEVYAAFDCKPQTSVWEPAKGGTCRNGRIVALEFEARAIGFVVRAEGRAIPCRISKVGVTHRERAGRCRWPKGGLRPRAYPLQPGNQRNVEPTAAFEFAPRLVYIPAGRLVRTGPSPTGSGPEGSSPNEPAPGRCQPPYCLPRELRATIEQRLNVLEERVASREDVYQRNMEFIGKRLLEHAVRLDRVEDKLDRVANKLDRVSDKLEAVATDVASLKSDVAGLKTGMDALPKVIAKAISKEFNRREKKRAS